MTNTSSQLQELGAYVSILLVANNNVIPPDLELTIIAIFPIESVTLLLCIGNHK